MCDCASPFPLSCRNLAGYLRSWQTCASRLFRPTWLKESFSVISHDFTISQYFPSFHQGSTFSAPLDVSRYFKSFQVIYCWCQAADRDAESRMLFGEKLKAQQDAMDEAQNHRWRAMGTKHNISQQKSAQNNRESNLRCSNRSNSSCV